MRSIERGGAKSEKKEAPVASTQEVLGRGLVHAEDRFVGAKEVLRKGKVELHGTSQEDDLAGAMVDLQTASRTLHTEVLGALGSLAEKKNAPEAQRLVQTGKGLLEAQGRFAQAA